MCGVEVIGRSSDVLNGGDPKGRDTYPPGGDLYDGSIG
jgi:hypothetical protein